LDTQLDTLALHLEAAVDEELLEVTSHMRYTTDVAAPWLHTQLGDMMASEQVSATTTTLPQSMAMPAKTASCPLDEYHLYEYHKEHFTISTDPARLDLDVIHGFLYHCYWSPGIPRELVAKSIQHSFCFGLYENKKQVGFARVVTDYTSFAYLADVFVLPTQRHQGLGIWLVESVINCPALQEIRSFLLATRDAHGLYRKFGFENADERRIMVKRYDIAWRNQALIRE
jgi:N-acetylglutamate synthase-like GNAT family acetyltransferase